MNVSGSFNTLNYYNTNAVSFASSTRSVDFTETQDFSVNIKGMQIEEMWITGDVRPGRGEERWLNLILRKI